MRRRVQAAVVSAVVVALICILVPAALGTPRRHPAYHPQRPGPAMAYVWLTNDIFLPCQGKPGCQAAAGTVTPIRLRTGTALRPMSFRGAISAVAASPDGRAVYVFSFTVRGKSGTGTDYVTRIDAATGKAGRPVRLAYGAQQFQPVEIAPGGKLAYMIEFAVWPGSRNLSFALVQIDLATGAEHRIMTTGSGPFAITPDGRRAYVLDGNQVMSADLTTRTVLRPITLAGPAGTLAASIAITPDGRTVYVSALAAHHDIQVTPISTATDAAGTPIKAAWSGVTNSGQIVINPDGTTAYVDGGRYVTPIDIATGRALKPITVASAFSEWVGELQISPSGTRGYLSSPIFLATWVQPLDLLTGGALPQVSLPPGYATTAIPAFAPDGRVLYVPAEYSEPGKPTIEAVVPITTATQHVGQPIRFGVGDACTIKACTHVEQIIVVP